MAASSAARKQATAPPAPQQAVAPLKRPVDWPADWIVPLAEPYLRGYVPAAERSAALAGYRFFAPGSAVLRRSTGAPKRRTAQPSTGFFVGYLLGDKGVSFLRPEPPECLVFWFAEPVGGALHRRLAGGPQSLARRTAEYIRWLTHRPPRFELFENQRILLVRHDSMRLWPQEKIEHLSRNFFIETLAWLVRSALVRRLPEELTQGGLSRQPPARPRRSYIA